MTNQKQIRASFWEMHPEFKKGYKRRADKKPVRYIEKRQNDYNATIRTAFCMYVDFLMKSGEITEKLASNVTL